jgi:antitoxin VapB
MVIVVLAHVATELGLVGASWPRPQRTCALGRRVAQVSGYVAGFASRWKRSIYAMCLLGSSAVKITKVFQSGNSQAVRIPVEFQFDVSEVEIERRGNELVLRPPSQDLAGAFESLAAMPDDCFTEPREDPLPQQRDGL